MGSNPTLTTYLEIIVNWLDWEAYIFARVGSSPTLKTKKWIVSYNWLERLIVNQGVTGSSPVQSANNKWVGCFRGRKVQTVNLVNVSSIVGSNPTLPSLSRCISSLS